MGRGSPLLRFFCRSVSTDGLITPQSFWSICVPSALSHQRVMKSLRAGEIGRLGRSAAAGTPRTVRAPPRATLARGGASSFAPLLSPLGPTAPKWLAWKGESSVKTRLCTASTASGKPSAFSEASRRRVGRAVDPHPAVLLQPAPDPFVSPAVVISTIAALGIGHSAAQASGERRGRRRGVELTSTDPSSSRLVLPRALLAGARCVAVAACWTARAALDFALALPRSLRPRTGGPSSSLPRGRARTLCTARFFSSSLSLFIRCMVPGGR